MFSRRGALVFRVLVWNKVNVGAALAANSSRSAKLFAAKATLTSNKHCFKSFSALSAPLRENKSFIFLAGI